MTFPCTGCGLCCKSVGLWVSIANTIPIEQRTPEQQEIAVFPYATDSNGYCTQLDENNGCKVYENRPSICSIERTWERYYQQESSLNNYFAQAAAFCNSMMDEAGLPEELRVVF